jgi:UPF0271 protein
MKEVASLAIKHQVRIGAHPSYPDPRNFGRVSLEMDKNEFQDSIEAQVSSLKGVLDSLNVSLHHIKAHGALYNDLASGGPLAMDYLEVMEPRKEEQILYVPYGSVFERMARDRGFRVWEEAFADRAYRPDGSLVSRSVAGAVLTEPGAVTDQVLEMITRNQVKCSDGSYFSIKPRTICVHGDNPKATDILMRLADSLREASIQVKI